jgi:hypothetical protein
MLLFALVEFESYLEFGAHAAPLDPTLQRIRELEPESISQSLEDEIRARDVLACHEWFYTTIEECRKVLVLTDEFVVVHDNAFEIECSQPCREVCLARIARSDHRLGPQWGMVALFINGGLVAELSLCHDHAT